MTELVSVLSLTLAAAGIILVLFLARQGRIEAWVLQAMATVCVVALVVMLATDWPWEVLAAFWRDHSVLSATLSTLLLVGTGFLAFEAIDVAKQDRLNRTLTAAGLGGLVDHMVDVEVVLALVQADEPPDTQRWAEWQSPGKPLRWLRTDRHLLERRSDGGPDELDPRTRPTPDELPKAAPAWRLLLLDQAVRRVIAATRDWSPVVGRSRDGLEILVRIGDLRNELLLLADDIEDGRLDGAAERLRGLRQECRRLALAMELASGVREPRPEVLTEDGGDILERILNVAEREDRITVARQWLVGQAS